MERLEGAKSRGSFEPVSEQLRGFFGFLDITQKLPLVFSGLILSAIVALLLFIFYMTFVPGLPTKPGLTLQHWTDVASSYMLTEVIPNTLIVGIGTVLVASFFSLPLAWLLNRTSLPFRNTFITLMAVKVIVPGFITTMGWIMLVNDRIGLFNKAIGGLLGVERVPLTVMNNPFGMAWVLGLVLTPTMFFLISGPMRALDPTLEEAASVAGLNQWRTLRRVSFPLMWPGTLAGIIYTFMTAISIFEVPAMLGASNKVPVLASELFYAVRPGGPTDVAYGAAGVYGMIIAVPSILALYFYLRVLTQARSYEVITGKAYRPRAMDLGRFKWLGLGFVLLYLLLAVVLPMAVLGWASLLPFLEMPSAEALSKVSLINFDDLLANLGGITVISNTVVVDGQCLVAGVVFQLHDFVGGGANPSAAAQGHGHHRDDAPCHPGSCLRVCPGDCGDLGFRVVSLAAEGGDAGDHCVCQCHQSAVLRDAGDQCGAGADSTGIGGMRSVVRSQESDRYLADHRAAGQAFSGVCRAVDGVVDFS
jgi:ABC-type spermidine/putrescine transport system permease subunit I